jgi:uncharacterized membrane protein
VIAGQLALLVAAFFTGAAAYVSLVEHPARDALETGARLIQWRPAYKRGAAMQAPLALLGFALGLLAWWQTGDWLRLAGAFILVANWPYTFIAIMPVNKRLLATDPAAAGGETRTLLEQWGKLHAVRTALGFAAMLVFLWASMR